jgi:hypothetical protein
MQLVGWAVVAPFLLYLSFHAFIPVMQSLARRFASGEHSPVNEHSPLEANQTSQGRTSSLNGTVQVRRIVEHVNIAGIAQEDP